MIIDFIVSWSFLAFIFIGAFSGACAGLLSVGGGIIFVPAFSYIFSVAHLVPADKLYHATLATSIACIFFNFFIGFLTHRKNKNIVYTLATPMSIGVTIGSTIGSILVWHIPEMYLKILFILSCISILITMSLPDRFYCHTDATKNPSSKILVSHGIFTGTLCTLVAMGGSFAVLPLLRRFNVPAYESIGLCSLVGSILAGVGTLGYLYHAGFKWDGPFLGYIYLPALLCILAISNITTRACVHLSKHISPVVLRISILLLGCFSLTHFYIHNLHHHF